MKIKNAEWISFKKYVLETISILEEESDRFDIPEETEDFRISIDGCIVNPIFQKKPEMLKIEYDCTLCNTQIRTLSISTYKDAARIEVTLKNEQHIKKII